jgi:hypothetical protein
LEENYLDSGSEADEIEDGGRESDSDGDNLSLEDLNLGDDFYTNIRVQTLHK